MFMMANEEQRYLVLGHWTLWQVTAFLSIGFLVLILVVLFFLHRRQQQHSSKAAPDAALQLRRGSWKCPAVVATCLPSRIQPEESLANYLFAGEAQSDTSQNRGLFYHPRMHRRISDSLSSSSTLVPAEKLDEPQARLWQVSMKFWYKMEQRELVVTLYRATCSPPPTAGTKNYKTFVFLQLRLSAHGSSVFQTNSYANIGAPTIDESFTFSLKLTLYEVDREKRPLHKASALVDLKEFHLSSEEVQYVCKELTPPKKHQRVGDALIALCYQQSSETLFIHIRELRNLHFEHSELFHVFYLKLAITVGSRTTEEKLIAPKLTPDEAFVTSHEFKMTAKAVHCTQVRCALHGKMLESTVDTLLGDVRLGRSMKHRNSSVEEHWNRMLENDDTTVEKWYKIRSHSHSSVSAFDQ